MEVPVDVLERRFDQSIAVLKSRGAHAQSSLRRGALRVQTVVEFPIDWVVPIFLVVVLEPTGVKGYPHGTHE
jgi:hypothetical protein